MNVNITNPTSSMDIQSKFRPKLSVDANTSIRIASVRIEIYISTLDPLSQGGHPILIYLDIAGLRPNYDITEDVLDAPILGNFGIIYAS